MTANCRNPNCPEQQQEWKRRHETGHPVGTVESPPNVAFLRNDSITGAAMIVDPGWYFNHTACKTTVGPYQSEWEAWAENSLHTCPVPARLPFTRRVGQSLWTAAQDAHLLGEPNATVAAEALGCSAKAAHHRRRFLRNETP